MPPYQKSAYRRVAVALSLFAVVLRRQAGLVTVRSAVVVV